MATLTRTNSRATPAYKDYVNFLGGYKSGKKDDDNSDSSGISVKNFSLSSSSNSTSSSSIASDVTDFSKNTCTPYNTYLENSKNKKFNPVKPHFEEKNDKNLKKTEIYIEIQPTVSVSEVSKMFENKDRKPKNNKINSKISIFEKQISMEKPKISEKPVLGNRSPPPKIDMVTLLPSPPPLKIEATINNERESTVPLPPPVMAPELVKMAEIPPPPPMMGTAPPKLQATMTYNVEVPPPPPMPSGVAPIKKTGSGIPAQATPKLQATLTKGPQTKYSVSNPNGMLPTEIDRNDPLVRKLVYGTLRGLYGAYHDKATDMLSTLPRNMVVKSNGVQDRIDQIASNGDLDKLNGRVNPKLEQE